MNLPLHGLGGVHVTGSGPEKQMTLDIIKGRYYDFYDTCEVLAAEMACQRRIRQNRRTSSQKLPLLDRTRDLFDFTNRFAGIGINVLTILQNAQDEDGVPGNYFLLHKRAANGVAEGCNSYHVVPAGSYQPATVEFPDTVDAADKNLNSTVVREFDKELLGVEAFSAPFNSELFTTYGQVPTASLIGIGLNPLNTKTEIMACLVLDVRQTPLFEGRQSAADIRRI